MRVGNKKLIFIDFSATSYSIPKYTTSEAVFADKKIGYRIGEITYSFDFVIRCIPAKNFTTSDSEDKIPSREEGTMTRKLCDALKPH